MESCLNSRLLSTHSYLSDCKFRPGRPPVAMLVFELPDCLNGCKRNFIIICDKIIFAVNQKSFFISFSKTNNVKLLKA